MDGQRSLPQHIATLDGLRGLAAVAVLWFHFPQVGHSRAAALFQDLSQKTLAGSLGVDVFFVLSGFLITRIILRQVRSGSFSLRNFLIRRALRIFPIYYLSLLVLACCQPVTDVWWSALAYVSNYHLALDPSPTLLQHTWSLAVEEQFYLLWPVLFVCLPLTVVRRLAMPVIPLLSVVAAYATLRLAPAELGWALVYRGLPFRALSLLLGAALAFGEPQVHRWPAGRVFAGACGSYLAMLAAAWGAARTGLPEFRFGVFVLSAGTSLLVVQYAIGCDLRQGVARRLLTTRPLLACGQISYGIYLYHYLILAGLFTPPGMDPRDHVLSPGQAVLALALCLGVPAVSYVIVERPLLRLKSYFDAADGLQDQRRIPERDADSLTLQRAA
jgi:peptidoglycan/LPS O-acetylase OafA/YrhL